MSNIGEPMVATIPVVGTAGTGYATLIDAFLEEVKERLEAQVPLSSLLVSTLDMQNNPIINVQYLGLYPQIASPTTPTGSIQYYNGEFYLVTPSGAVKVTNAGSLNAASIGGITGDYGGSNPAQWRFVDADQTFYGYDDYAAGKWAHVQARDFNITGAYTGSPRIRLTWAGSGSYTLTLPAAAPGLNTLPLQITTGGVMTASADFAANLTAPDFKLSATRIKLVPAHTARIRSATDTSHSITAGWLLDSSTPLPIEYPVILDEGDRLKAWSLYLLKTSGVGSTFTVTLIKTDCTTGIASAVGGTSNTALGWYAMSVSGLTETMVAGTQYHLAFSNSGSPPSGELYMAQLTYDRP